MRAVIPSEEQVIEWITSLSNWGRWGEDDQYGCLNLITPREAQTGRSIGSRRYNGKLRPPHHDRHHPGHHVPGAEIYGR